mgnify:CR=1 FL=1
MPRVFIAVDLPQPVRDRLAMLRGGIPGARWVPPENYHLTLKFLGEIDHGAIEDVIAALADLVMPGFAVAIDGVGHFGTERKPSVLFARVARSDLLQRLHDKVDRATVAAGLPPDDRKFAPHVTLAYLRQANIARLARWQQENNLLRVPDIPVARVDVVESHTGGEASHYVSLAEIPLLA